MAQIPCFFIKPFVHKPSDKKCRTSDQEILGFVIQNHVPEIRHEIYQVFIFDKIESRKIEKKKKIETRKYQPHQLLQDF